MGRNSRRYEPSEPAGTLRVNFVSTLVAVTLAPGTSAPEGSVTVPRMVAVVSCAKALAVKRADASTRSMRRQLRDLEPVIIFTASIWSYRLSQGLLSNKLRSSFLESLKDSSWNEQLSTTLIGCVRKNVTKAVLGAGLNRFTKSIQLQNRAEGRRDP